MPQAALHQESSFIYKRHHPDCYQQQVQKPGSVMVWGCVSALGKGNLHFCDGTINAEKYIEILEHNMLLWRRGRGRAESAAGERVWRRAVIRRPSEWLITPVFNSSDWRGDGYSSPLTCEGGAVIGTREAGLTDCARQGASQEFCVGHYFIV